MWLTVWAVALTRCPPPTAPTSARPPAYRVLAVCSAAFALPVVPEVNRTRETRSGSTAIVTGSGSGSGSAVRNSPAKSSAPGSGVSA
ncbi:hypothetical protein SSPIM334S_07245 [Streptomyces spiroverticillatus]